MSDPVAELDALLMGVIDDDEIMLIGEVDGLLAGSLIWRASSLRRRGPKVTDG